MLTDTQGRTSSMAASYHAHLDVVNYVLSLENLGDININDNKGSSGLQLMLMVIKK